MTKCVGEGETQVMRAEPAQQFSHSDRSFPNAVFLLDLNTYLFTIPDQSERVKNHLYLTTIAVV